MGARCMQLLAQRFFKKIQNGGGSDSSVSGEEFLQDQ